MWQSLSRLVWSFHVLAFLLAASAFAADITPEYRSAVADAQIAEITLERIHTLTPIRGDNDALIWEGTPGASRVLMVSWVGGNYYDPYIGRDYTLSPTRELWVSVAPEVKKFCAANNIQASAAANRLAQLIGMPFDYGNIKFVEAWVNPADLFRPTPDPEITDTVADYDFPEGVSEEHKQWFNNNRNQAYTNSTPFPWTRLGYTYDWAKLDKIGLSEYVIRRGSTFGVKTVTSTVDYCAGTSTQPDILWRNTRLGKTVIWKMRTTVRGATALPNDVGPTWQIQATGDFNADGKTDLLCRNQGDGRNIVFYMDGATWLNQDWIAEVPAPWVMVGTGDFNADGKPDILWRNPNTGRNIVWFMVGPEKFGEADIENVASSWHVGGVADFDGDGQPDILWRNDTTNNNVIMLLNGTSRKSLIWLDNVPAPWNMAGVGDFNRDGSPDILWNNPNNGRNLIMLMSGMNKQGLVELQNTPQGWGWTMAGVGVFH